MATLSAGTRRRALDRLASGEPLDLLVIGGGVTGRTRVEAGPGARHRTGRRGGEDPHRGSGAPSRRRTGRAAAGVGPRGARRCRGLAAPNAGDDAQDPQSAAVRRARVRHLRRCLGARRVAPAGRRTRGGARRGGARRTVRQCARRAGSRTGARAGAGAAGGRREAAVPVGVAAVADRDAFATVLPSPRCPRRSGGRRTAGHPVR